MAPTEKKIAPTDSELWQAFMEARRVAKIWWDQYWGYEAGDKDVKAALELKFLEAAAVKSRAFIAFFGDGRFYDDFLAISEQLGKLEEEVAAARAQHVLLQRRKEHIALAFCSETDLQTAIEMRDKMRTEEDAARQP